METFRRLSPHLAPPDPSAENEKLKMQREVLVNRLSKYEKRPASDILMELEQGRLSDPEGKSDQEVSSAKFFGHTEKNTAYPMAEFKKVAKAWKQETIRYFASSEEATEAGYTIK